MKKIITSIVLSLGLCFKIQAQDSTTQNFMMRYPSGRYFTMNVNRWQNLTGTAMYTMGNVGVGTSTPNFKLDVDAGTGAIQMAAASGASNSQFQQFPQGVSVIQRENNNPSVFTVGLGSGVVMSKNNGNFLLYSSGQILIGQGSSFTPLHDISLRGTLRLITGNEGAGKVLTSDASGGATWQTSGIVYTEVATYAALLALPSSTSLREVIVAADENKSLTYTVYHITPAGKRIFIASTVEN